MLDVSRLPVFLLPAEAATLLRTTTKAIYTKVERGLIPGVIRNGSRILFDRDLLVRAVRSGKVR